MAQNMYLSDSDGADALEPIAIVGMACRFPGHASTPESFWELLSNARKGHGEIPKDRFNADAWRHSSHERKGAIQPSSGFFLDEDPAVFDAPFFSITAKEAAGMDPMQRKLLEVAYEGFENAGIPMDKLAGSDTSVYIGVMTNDYELISQSDIYDLPQNAASGTSRAMLANRISWFFDLHGPSLAMDTACSSSLYAFHLACQSLRLGESRQALVGGANMILHPNFISQLSSMHMLSPDGISHSFDARANGYARGEAITTVVVKRLKDALADGDTIRAVVRGTGVNQDGHTPGITMPSSDAQAALIRSTYAAAGLSYHDTGYFEAHGTGTPLGDPLELDAVGAVFGPSRRGTSIPLYVGSVKTNVGHTEGTAGLAGVAKAVLALEKGYIPANAGFETLNPKLRLEEWGLALPLETMPWPTPGLRRVSINSFGFGGSNAHVILDDAHNYLHSRDLVGNHQTTIFDDDVASSSSDSGVSDVRGTGMSRLGMVDRLPKVLPFSAYDQAGVKRIASTYAKFAEAVQAQTQQGSILHDMAYTLAARRTNFAFRTFAVASSLKDLTKGLSNAPTLKRSSKNGSLAFVFTGQGAQWATMGKELLSVPVFEKSVLRSQEYLDSLGCQWNAVELLCEEESTRLDIPEYCQPICTVLQVALVDLLAHWGVTPSGTVGHSSGEIAAAYAAGGISHASAVKIAYYRGLYVEEIQRRLQGRQGAMMAAGLSAEEAHDLVKEFSTETLMARVACINSPASVTLSGDEEVINRLEVALQQRGKFARKLRVKTAYHSPHMEVVADDFLGAMGELELRPRFVVPMFSSVTEEVLTAPAQLDAAYWVKNMVSPVLFKGAVEALLGHTTVSAEGGNARRQRKVPVRWSGLVEVGPAETLKGPLDQIAKVVSQKLSSELTYTSLLKRKTNAVSTALEAAGLLWATGQPVDLLKVNEDPEIDRTRVLANLPSYPWQHAKRFWQESLDNASVRLQNRPRGDLLGVAVSNQNPLEPRWRTPLRLEEQPWMEDHIITGTILYPAAGMLVMVLEAVMEIAANSETKREITGVQFTDVNFHRGLVIPHDNTVETFLSMRPDELFPSRFQWTIYSIPPGGTWQKHSFGAVTIVYKDPSPEVAADWQAQVKSFGDIAERASKEVDVAAFYTQLKAVGMEYGALFTNVVDAAVLPGQHTGHATITIPDTRATMPLGIELPHHIHPATLDAIFHLIFIALFEGNPMDEPAIPVTVDSIFIATDQLSGAGAKYVGFAQANKTSPREASGNLVVSDESWSAAKVVVQNMVVRQVSSSGDKSKSSSSPFSQAPKRVGRLEWREDVDALSSNLAAELLPKHHEHLSRVVPAKTPAATHLAAWLELLSHKEADLRVLVLHAEQNADIIALARYFAPQEERGLRFAEVKFAASSQEVADKLLTDLAAAQYPLLNGADTVAVLAPKDMGTKPSGSLDQLGKFDLVIGDTAGLVGDIPSIGLTHIKHLLHLGGRVALLGRGAGVEEQLANVGFGKLDVQLDGLVVASTHEQPIRTELEFSEIYLIIRPQPSEAASVMEKALTQKLTDSGLTVKTCNLSEAATLGPKAFISLIEFDQPWTINLTTDGLDQFRSLVFGAKYLMWVTRGGIVDRGETSLQFSPTTGLLRTIRTEVPQIVLPHLDLSPLSALSAENQADLAITCLRLSTKELYKEKNNEMEFAESDGRLLIPRVVADLASDLELALHSSQLRSVPGKLWSTGDNGAMKSLKLNMGDSADVQDGVWISDEATHQKPLAEDEIEIQTRYVSVDGSELVEASRQFTPKLAKVALGRVVRLGSKVSHFSISDVVVVLADNEADSAFRTHVRQHFSLVQRVPQGISLEQAVSLPMSFMIAYHALVEVCRLEAGETVLLHNTADAVTQAAIQIARQLDAAAVFVKIDDDTKRAVLVDEYGVHEQHVIQEDEHALIRTVSRLTQGRGVDVLLSAATGASLNYATETIGAYGRLALVGTNKAVRPADISANLFKRNATVSRVNVGQLNREKRARLLQTAFGYLRSGRVRRFLPTTVHSVHDLVRVFSPDVVGSQGKIVIELEDDAVVPVMAPPPAPLELDPGASYVISGGLGALGLTIAKNMALRGARHLVILSRSGVTTNRQEMATQEIKSLGCRVDALKCDVTVASEVEQVMRKGLANGWRDSIFQNMTIEKWNTATRPKILGTWNLHALLPRDLDFFILLSSMSGIIGNSGQANYCAGNAYEDAVARHRRSLGLAATTLNIGLVTDASHFNESSTIEDYLKKYGHWASALVADSEMQVVISTVMREGALGVPDQLLVGIVDDVRRDGRTAWSHDRKFDHRIARTGSSSSTESESGRAVGEAKVEDEMAAAKTVRDAALVVENALKANVAAAMTANPDDIDVERPLHSFGVDSLKAVEVRNWIFRSLRCDISVFDILSPQPLAKLAVRIVARSALTPPEVATQALAEG
ncbi:Polyketide synthase [Tolypocladium capitatum]|uniref:Polyketide synthase n=1 Tax=Tolypocladium capitatum TaxID=45235 RepID=A0A2K3PZJ7_9HYPO|nr:Polyketide synthase [Tolypocladium capitatum]